MKRAALYARVSSEEQARAGTVSLAEQLALCRQYAVERGYAVVLEGQDVQTGLDPARPAYQRILEGVRSGQVDVAVVWRFDRWGRELGEAFRSIQELRQLGAAVISVTQPGQDPVVQGIFLLLGYGESHAISERTRMALRARAERGAWLAAPPLGYTIERRGERSTLALDPFVAPLLRALFEDAATGQYSLMDLALRAQVRGLRSRYGRLISRSAVDELIHNPVYRGAVVYGRKPSRKFGASQESAGGIITVEGAVPAVVDAETWWQVQAHVYEHRTVQASIRKSRALLTSLVWCGRCGRRCYGTGGGRAEVIKLYICGQRQQYGKDACDLPRAFGGGIEAAIRQAVMAEFSITPAIRRQAMALVEQQAAARADGQAAYREQLERERDRHHRERRELARRLMRGVIPEDVYLGLEADEVQAIRRIEEELASLPAERPHADTAALLAQVAAVDWPTLDREGWRAMLVLLVDRITLHGGNEFAIQWKPGVELVGAAVTSVSQGCGSPTDMQFE